MSSIFNPEKIENQLKQLLQQQGTHEEVRTSLFNLIIVSKDIRDMEAPLNFLMGRRAARVIHIIMSDQPETSVEVSARCLSDELNRGVCFQEVIIKNGKDNHGLAPGSWLPLLIRDIPVYLFWNCKLDSEKLSLFGEQADKVIIDSKHFAPEKTEKFISILIQLQKENHLAVADFAFRRLHPVQVLTGRCFDYPEGIKDLNRIKEIRFTGGARIEAVYFFGWLASRLNWHTGESGLKNHRNESLTIAHQFPGNIEEGVEIEFILKDGRKYSLSGGDSGCGELYRPSEDVHHYPVEVPTSGKLLLAEVDGNREEFLFIKSIEAVLDNNISNALILK